jgi:hypothetical protein
MSRRSTLKRRRARQRRKHEQEKLALRLPQVRKVSTFELIQELERRTHILAEALAEQY